MQAIDVFSGAGGMSVGATAAGMKIICGVEVDQFAAKTFKLNHPNSRMIAKNVKDVSLEDFGVINKKEPLILFGGPPCQGFSTSNQRTRNLDNENNWLFLEYLRIAALLNPDWIVFENVKGLIETKKGIFLEQITGQLQQLGFTVSIFILNAADYGVPQNRERLFVVGSRDGIKIQAPEKKNNNKYISVSEAICDLPSLINGANIDSLPYKNKAESLFAKTMRKKLKKCTGHLVTKNSQLIIERYTHIPQGGNWQNIPEKLMANYTDRNRCHTGIYYRLKEDSPSIVVGNFRKNMLIHPWENRGLSIREAARLQSFPDNFVFAGSIGYQQQQVGNAVPPLLAKAVFEQILRSA